MRILTVREYETVTIGASGPLSDRDGDALWRLLPSVPSQSMTWVHRGIRFGSFCGVLRVGDLTIEILPKVGALNADNGVARGVLVTMLRHAGFLAWPRLGSATLAQQHLHLLDVFILDFCGRISELLKQGAIRAYQTFDSDLSSIRGRVWLSKQLRKTSAEQAQIACLYDELSIDNAHNQALKSMLKRLFDVALGSKAKSAANALLIRMDEVSDRLCSVRDVEILAFNRLTALWKPVFDQALLFLRGLFPDVRGGREAGASLLFDMERLFEAYIGVHLRRAWSSAGEYPRIVLQGPQRHLALSDEGPVFRMRPDATLLTTSGDVERVFDAKWKTLEVHMPNLGVSRDDAYQLASYAGRYGCERVVLIYPASQGVGAGLVGSFQLELPQKPAIDVFAVDLVSLAGGAALPDGLGPGMQHQTSSPIPVSASPLFA